ncbi:hypothetical protein Hanom_Chr15g01352581 [Helianthus anomalus]
MALKIILACIESHVNRYNVLDGIPFLSSQLENTSVRYLFFNIVFFLRILM